MPAAETITIIEQTKKWITDVVIGCGFCPFAAKEMQRDSIHYSVLFKATRESALNEVISCLYQLDNNESIGTSLLILPEGFISFDEYLQLIALTEALLVKENYEGIYQVASFHPGYLFAGSNVKDPANYTNRSPYPMLHFLRESQVSIAVDNFPGIDDVPQRNVRFANERGLSYMQQLLASCIRMDI